MENLFEIKWYEEGNEDDLDLDGKGKGDGDGEGGNEPTYSEADMKKAIDRRQKALADKRKEVEARKALEEKMAGMPDPEEHAKLKDSFTDLKNQLAELKDKQEEEDLKKIEDERERAKAQMEREFSKERQKLQRQMDELSSQVDTFNVEKQKHAESLKRFRSNNLDTEIVVAASKKAYNPKQIVNLVKHEFEYDEGDDRWYKNLYDNRGKPAGVLTVEEFVDTFLSDKDNENLVKADIKRGSDMPKGQAKQRQAKSGDPLPKMTPDMEMWARRNNFYEIMTDEDHPKHEWVFKTYERLHNPKKEE
jgi:hypothetical protein